MEPKERPKMNKQNAITALIAAGYTQSQATEIVEKNPPATTALTPEARAEATAAMHEEIAALSPHLPPGELWAAKTKIVQEYADKIKPGAL
jgi:hypothetical protein